MLPASAPFSDTDTACCCVGWEADAAWKHAYIDADSKQSCFCVSLTRSRLWFSFMCYPQHIQTVAYACLHLHAGWQAAEAATAGEGVRGEVRSRPPWPVDESLRWGPHAASSCAGGPSFGFMGAPAAAGSAGKGECATSCSSGNADAAALVQLSRPTLPSSIPASAAGEGASAAAGDCLVPRMNLGAVGSCSHDGLNSGSRVMMPWGSRAGVPRPSPPPLGQLVALDSPTPATSASPPCMWPVSPSASTTAAPNSLATTPTAGTGSGVTGPVGVLPNRKKLVPAELGSVISAEGLGRSPRGNVRVCHSQPHNAWLVLCCAGGAESRAFSVLQLGYEGAKRVALLYAAQCKHSCTICHR